MYEISEQTGSLMTLVQTTRPIPAFSVAPTIATDFGEKNARILSISNTHRHKQLKKKKKNKKQSINQKRTLKNVIQFPIAKIKNIS